MDKKASVIVSMTSFPAAMPYAEEAVRSVLRGSVLPDKLVLYLTRAQFEGKSLPESLIKLQERNPIFEIRYCDRDIRSYTKLIPALTDFPDDVIVTVDDDVDYHRDMLRELLAMHSKLPDVIIAQRARRIKKDLPYRKWTKFHWHDFLLKRVHVRLSTLQTGVGGVLYPPHSLCPEMLDRRHLVLGGGRASGRASGPCAIRPQPSPRNRQARLAVLEMDKLRRGRRQERRGVEEDTGEIPRHRETLGIKSFEKA